MSLVSAKYPLMFRLNNTYPVDSIFEQIEESFSMYAKMKKFSKTEYSE